MIYYDIGKFTSGVCLDVLLVSRKLSANKYRAINLRDSHSKVIFIELVFLLVLVFFPLKQLASLRTQQMVLFAMSIAQILLERQSVWTIGDHNQQFFVLQ